MTEDELAAIREKCEKAIEDAVEFAEKSPYPDESELFEDLYI